LEYGREGEAQVLTGHRYFKYFFGPLGLHYFSEARPRIRGEYFIYFISIVSNSFFETGI